MSTPSPDPISSLQIDSKITTRTSLLSQDSLLQAKKNERYAYLLGIFAQFIWGLNGVQVKTFKPNFPEIYSDDNVLFWRMLVVTLIGYFRCKQKNIKIQRHSEIKNLKWFFCRNAVSYLFIIFWIKMMSYFRISTISVITGTGPILIIIFSVLLLGEKFHMRYLIGVLLCLFGSTIIIFNDRRPKAKSQILNDNTFIGILYAIGNVALCSLSCLGQKVLTNDRMDPDLQNFYFGIYTAAPALVVSLFQLNLGLKNILYILYVSSNGLCFYLGNYLTTLAYQFIDISKFQPITYLAIVFTFLLGAIILREPVFFSDIIGACIICGFQYFNMRYSIKEKEEDMKNKHSRNNDENKYNAVIGDDGL